MRIDSWMRIFGSVALVAVLVVPAMASGETARQAKPSPQKSDSPSERQTEEAGAQKSSETTQRDTAKPAGGAEAQEAEQDAAQCQPQAPVNTLEDWFGVETLAAAGSPELRRAKALVLGWREVPASAVAGLPQRSPSEKR
jgi:FtsZ-interacting cell division protein ZipA